MMRFERFYEHFLHCKEFYAEMAKHPTQERVLALVGAAFTKFDAETHLVAIHDKKNWKSNAIIILARHRPPFWNSVYSKHLDEAIGGGSNDAAYALLREANIRLICEFSQSPLGPASCLYPVEEFPRIAAFEPNWDTIFDSVLDLGYSTAHVHAVSTGYGAVVFTDGRIMALERKHYRIAADRREAAPAKAMTEDAQPLCDVFNRRMAQI